MTSYVSAGLRRAVEARADGVCEYCLIDERDTFLGCQVDHVVSEKHGGTTDSGNLAFACACCNRAKGSDVGSIAAMGEFTRFYNPRTDHWGDHFRLCGVVIEPRTPVGEVTANILGLNGPERIMERQSLERIGRYPPPQAVHLLADDRAEPDTTPDGA